MSDPFNPDPDERIHLIEFTQYLMPDGRPVPNSFVTTKDVHDMGQRLIEAGYRFEIEMLRDYYTISATIVGKQPGSDEDTDLVYCIKPNTPEIGQHIDKMIRDFYATQFPEKHNGN